MRSGDVGGHAALQEPGRALPSGCIDLCAPARSFVGEASLQGAHAHGQRSPGCLQRERGSIELVGEKLSDGPGPRRRRLGAMLWIRRRPDYLGQIPEPLFEQRGDDRLVAERALSRHASRSLRVVHDLTQSDVRATLGSEAPGDFEQARAEGCALHRPRAIENRHLPNIIRKGTDVKDETSLVVPRTRFAADRGAELLCV